MSSEPAKGAPPKRDRAWLRQKYADMAMTHFCFLDEADDAEDNPTEGEQDSHCDRGSGTNPREATVSDHVSRLGWQATVYRSTSRVASLDDVEMQRGEHWEGEWHAYPEGSEFPSSEGFDVRLATWFTRDMGWLKDLRSSGLAHGTGNGYPYRFVAFASAVRPHLAAQPGLEIVDADQLDDVGDNEVLLVEAWDQS